MKIRNVHIRILLFAVLAILSSALFAQDHSIEHAVIGSDGAVPVIGADPVSVETPPTEFAYTYDKWVPTRPGECSREEHNRFSARSPRDGKIYPTWHPTSLPAGTHIEYVGSERVITEIPPCSFGHNHGFNPALSILFAKVGTPLFGEVAEIMSEQDKFGHRHEDHYGFKVMVSNDVIYKSATGRTLVGAVMNTFHMGTHSPDAFTNNQHEQQAAMEFWYQDTGEHALFNHVKLMTTAGKASEIMQMCSPVTLIATGAAVPADSPISAPQNIGGSAGRRKIPTSHCTLARSPAPGTAYGEVWEIGSTILTPHEILAPANARQPERSYSPKKFAVGLRIHWYPNAKMVSRYYDVATGTLGRTLDTCWAKNELGGYIVLGGTVKDKSGCVYMRFLGVKDWTDPDSIFTGENLGLRLTTLQQNYPVGPVDYCTDVRATVGYPLNANGGCDPGLVQQHTSNTDLRDPVTGKIHVYTSTAQLIEYVETDPTVHAPN
jgi:hypothetical protein